MKVRMQAVTHKVSDEFSRSHEVVRKAWADAAAQLSSALIKIPGAVTAGSVEASSNETVARPKKRREGGTL